MRFYYLAALASMFFCCDNESLTGATSSSEQLQIPAGAKTEPFPDNPELVRVTLTDGSGNVIQSGIVKGGRREGNWVEYHAGGLVKSITPYVNGRMEGLRVELSNTGQLEKRMAYHNDKLHGDYREFRYSTLKEERSYENGKLEGTTKIYYDDGKIMEEGAYKNGTRDGVSKWYDQQGNVTIEYEYKNGELIKK